MGIDTKKCPSCAENIKIEAIKCRFCGESFEKKEEEKIKEVILYNGKAHWTNYVLPIFLILTLYGAPFGIYYIFYHKNKVIQLTNKKFTYIYGILNKKEFSLKLEKIESISINKNILDRLLGGGTIITSGTGGNNEPIKNVDNPDALKSAIEKKIS